MAATATKLEISNINDAKTAISIYRTNCEAIFQAMKSDIETLCSANFIGDASSGYLQFFNEKITPALTTQLTGTDTSVTAMLETLLAAVQQMLNPVDPDLSNANKSAGGD